MKLTIIASRDFNDYDLLCKVMKKFDVTSLVSIDLKIAERYAFDNMIDYIEHKPLYGFHRDQAELIRDIELFVDGDIIVLFWDSTSESSYFKLYADMFAEKTMYVVEYLNKKFYKYNPY